MKFPLMAFYVRIASLLLCVTIGRVFCAIPDQMPAPTVGNILATSVTVSFDTPIGTSDITTYIVTLEPRHRTTGTIHRTIPNDASLSSQIEQHGLTDCTVYYISVRAVNSGGEQGPSGNRTQFRTVQRLSMFHMGSPFTTFLDVFFNPSYPSVEKWLMQCREASNLNGSVVNSTVDSRFTGRLAYLSPDTSYELRVRPLRENGTDLPESEDLYSDWTRFKTDSLSILGSVILVKISYTADHGTENTMEWNYTRELIEDAYSHITNYGVTIIMNENDGSGKVRTHYRLKVPDKTLPSPTNFTISGGNFTDNFINNGARADGTPYLIETIDEPRNQYTLIYVSRTACDKIVERFMIVTPDDEDTFEIHLNVASSSSTTPEEDDSLVVNTATGSLVRDDDITVRNISPNTALTLTPHFLVKDCLVGGDSNPLYSEFFEATLTSSMEVETVIVTQTEPSPDPPSLVNTSYSVVSSETSLTIFFTAFEDAIQYDLFSSNSTYSVTLEEKDIDCSDFLKMEVSQLQANTTYIFTVNATTLGMDRGPNEPFEILRTRPIRTLPATTTATITTEAQTTSAAAPTTFSSNTTVETTTTNSVTSILRASTEADTDVSTAVAASSSLAVTTDNISNLVPTSKETTSSSAETTTTTEAQATTTGARTTFSSSTTSISSVIPTIVDITTTVSAVPTTQSTVSTTPPAPPQTSSSAEATTTTTTKAWATTTGAPTKFSSYSTTNSETTEGRSVPIWVYIVCGIVAAAVCTGIIGIVCNFCTRCCRKQVGISA